MKHLSQHIGTYYTVASHHGRHAFDHHSLLPSEIVRAALQQSPLSSVGSLRLERPVQEYVYEAMQKGTKVIAILQSPQLPLNAHLESSYKSLKALQQQLTVALTENLTRFDWYSLNEGTLRPKMAELFSLLDQHHVALSHLVVAYEAQIKNGSESSRLNALDGFDETPATEGHSVEASVQIQDLGVMPFSHVSRMKHDWFFETEVVRTHLETQQHLPGLVFLGQSVDGRKINDLFIMEKPVTTEGEVVVLVRASCEAAYQAFLQNLEHQTISSFSSAEGVKQSELFMQEEAIGRVKGKFLASVNQQLAAKVCPESGWKIDSIKTGPLHIQATSSRKPLSSEARNEMAVEVSLKVTSENVVVLMNRLELETQGVFDIGFSPVQGDATAKRSN